jgi:hypothetical protein
MHHVTEKWFADRTFQEPDWTASASSPRRRAPCVRRARAERGGTVGAIVAAIVR